MGGVSYLWSWVCEAALLDEVSLLSVIRSD